jgi:hypothetical protein
LLGEGVYDCKFFQTSKENGVEQTKLPIDFSVLMNSRQTTSD